MFRRVLMSACVLALAGSVHAATYYVSTTGGGNACTQSQPCGNIATGCKMKAGDTLYLRGGTYNQGILSSQMRIPSGTSWSNPVTIAGYPGETVTLKPSSGSILEINGYNGGTYQYLVIDHLVMDATNSGSVFIGGSGAHDIRLSNTEVKNSKKLGPACSLGGPEVCPGAQGVSVYGAARIEFSNMNVHDNGTNRLDHGFYVCGHDMVIRDSEIWNNSGYGIQVYDSASPGCSSGTQLLNNRIHDNRGDGAVTLNHGSGLAFVGNRVERNSGEGVQAPCGSGAKNIRIEGNTFSGNTGADMALCDGSRGAGPPELAARPEVAVPPPLPTPKNLRLLSRP